MKKCVNFLLLTVAFVSASGSLRAGVVQKSPVTVKAVESTEVSFWNWLSNHLCGPLRHCGGGGGSSGGSSSGSSSGGGSGGGYNDDGAPCDPSNDQDCTDGTYDTDDAAPVNDCTSNDQDCVTSSGNGGAVDVSNDTGVSGVLLASSSSASIFGSLLVAAAAGTALTAFVIYKRRNGRTIDLESEDRPKSGAVANRLKSFKEFMKGREADAVEEGFEMNEAKADFIRVEA